MEITRKDVVFFSYWTYKTMEIVRKKETFLHAILKLYCAYLLVVAKLSFCLYAFLEYCRI